MNAEDQRVIRTRQQLKESFITLVSERGFDDVSIREVATHANVSYRTFFRHYKDTRELIEDALADFIDEVSKLLVPPDSQETMVQNVTLLYQFIGQNIDLFRAYYHSPLKNESQTLLNFGKRVSRKTFGNTAMPSEMIEWHFVHSMINLQCWWVENDMPIPPEEMGRYALKLIVEPILQLEEKLPSEESG